MISVVLIAGGSLRKFSSFASGVLWVFVMAVFPVVLQGRLGLYSGRPPAPGVRAVSKMLWRREGWAIKGF
jgi:hypothetical protein